MIKVEIISGFLGAGKTTLIKKLIQGAFEGERVVLIENEYGEVGVDGGFMRDSGLTMTEINSGCICCTLAGDFITAIDEIVEKYNPDRIIIEPSGVGKLSEIREAVGSVAKKHDLVLSGCATVADVNRCRMYLRNFGEFYIDQIQNAGTVILSRTQTATPEKLEKAIALLREHNADVTIVTTPWEDLTPETMLRAIEAPGPLLLVSEVEHEHDEHCHEHHHEHDEHCDCHEHHHEHDELCSCGHDHHGHHHHHHGHDADEVFQDVGVETAKKFDRSAIEQALVAFDESDEYGMVIRAKGIVELTAGGWIEFDYVPGESSIRDAAPDFTGRICVIGSKINEAGIKALLGI